MNGSPPYWQIECFAKSLGNMIQSIFLDRYVYYIYTQLYIYARIYLPLGTCTYSPKTHLISMDPSLIFIWYDDIWCMLLSISITHSPVHIPIRGQRMPLWATRLPSQHCGAYPLSCDGATKQRKRTGNLNSMVKDM